MLSRFRQSFPAGGFSGETVISLALHAFFQFAGSMSFLFMNIYLWRLAHDISIVVVYNLVCYSVVPVGFLVGGYLAKKYDRMVTYRVGIGLYALFYLSIIAAGPLVVSGYILFAVFIGLAMGFYWCGILILMYDVTTEQNRLRYFGWNTIFVTVAGILGPSLSGNIIVLFSDTKGYLAVFGLALLVFLITAAGSLRIRKYPSHKRTYYLKYSYGLARRNKPWAKALISFVGIGLLEGLMFFLPGILLYQAVPREDLIGYLTIGFSLISVASSYLQTRIHDRLSTTGYVILAAFGIVGAAATLLQGVYAWTVVIFMILYSFFNPWMQNTMIVHYYSLVGTLPLKGHFRIESVVLFETCLNVGRVVAISAFWLLVVKAELLSTGWFVFLLACTQPLIILGLKEARKQDRTRELPL